MTWEQLGGYLAAPLLAIAAFSSKAVINDRSKQLGRITALEAWQIESSARNTERHEENLRNFADLKNMVTEVRTEQRLVLIDLKAEQRLVLAHLLEEQKRVAALRPPVSPTEGQ